MSAAAAAGASVVQRVAGLQRALTDARSDAERWRQEATTLRERLADADARLTQLRRSNEAAMADVVAKGARLEALLQQYAQAAKAAKAEAQRPPPPPAREVADAATQTSLSPSPSPTPADVDTRGEMRDVSCGRTLSPWEPHAHVEVGEVDAPPPLCATQLDYAAPGADAGCLVGAADTVGAAVLLAVCAALQWARPPARVHVHGGWADVPLCVGGWWRWRRVRCAAHCRSEEGEEARAPLFLAPDADVAMATAASAMHAALASQPPGAWWWDLGAVLTRLTGLPAAAAPWSEVPTGVLDAALDAGGIALVARSSGSGSSRLEGIVTEAMWRGSRRPAASCRSRGPACYLLCTAAAHGGSGWRLRQRWVAAEELTSFFDVVAVVPGALGAAQGSDGDDAGAASWVDLRFACDVSSGGTASVAIAAAPQDDLLARAAALDLVDADGQSHPLSLIPRGACWVAYCPAAVGHAMVGCVAAIRVPAAAAACLEFCTPTENAPTDADACGECCAPVVVTAQVDGVTMRTTRAVVGGRGPAGAPAPLLPPQVPETHEAETQTPESCGVPRPHVMPRQSGLVELRGLVAGVRELEARAISAAARGLEAGAELLLEHAAAAAALFFERAWHHKALLWTARAAAHAVWLGNVVFELLVAKSSAADRAAEQMRRAGEAHIALAARFTDWVCVASHAFQQGRIVQSHYWQRHAPQTLVSVAAADASLPSMDDLAFRGVRALAVLGAVFDCLFDRFGAELALVHDAAARFAATTAVASDAAEAAMACLERRLARRAATDVGVQCSGDSAARMLHRSEALQLRLLAAGAEAQRGAVVVRAASQEQQLRRALDELAIARDTLSHHRSALDRAEVDTARLQLRVQSVEEERESTIQRLAAAYDRIDELQTSLHECASQLAQIESTQYSIRAQFEEQLREREERHRGQERRIQELLRRLDHPCELCDEAAQAPHPRPRSSSGASRVEAIVPLPFAKSHRRTRSTATSQE